MWQCREVFAVDTAKVCNITRSHTKNIITRTSTTCLITIYYFISISKS